MKYQPPYGISDPDAGYINGDPSQARMGSIPPAQAFEYPMRELVHVITDSSIVPDDADLEQVAKGVRSQRMNYVEDTGSVNTLSVALSPPLAFYTVGLPIRVKIRNTNSGPSTIDAGAGRVPIRKPTGAEMAAGDLPAAGLAEMVYDGTVFQMINFGGAGGGPGNVFLTNIPYCVDTSTTPNLVIANFSPALTGYSAGQIFMVKIHNTNTSFSNINVNNLGLKPIYAQGGHPNWPLLPGDMQVGDVLVFVYDGSAFWIYANTTITQSVAFSVSTVDQFNQLFAALGRKRIATSGAVNINLAAAVFTPTAGSNATLTTYHPDADRIAIIGTMKPSQSPPRTSDFQRSGNTAAYRANDSAFNIQMLRSKYGTEVQIPTSGPGVGMVHAGPGSIVYENILVTGGNVLIIGMRGISTSGNSSIRVVQCSVWGSGDAGVGCDGGGYIYSQDSHACGCMTRGFIATGGGRMTLMGGGSYGNTQHGVEPSHGSSIVSDATDITTLSLGFQSSCNGANGVSCQTGTCLMRHGTVVANGNIDMYAFNMGIAAQYLSNIGSMSPAANTEGNLNSISINYG
jgi:hypothetical protein